MMKLHISHRIIRTGHIVEIEWDADFKSNPTLTLKTKNNEICIPVSNTGTKKFRLNNPNSKNTIILAADDEKPLSGVVLAIGSKKENFDKYYTVTNHKFKEKTKSFLTTYKTTWQRFPVHKRRLYIILVLLSAYVIFASSNPEIGHYIIIAAIIYILYLLYTDK